MAKVLAANVGHRLCYSMGFTRLTERETRIVDGLDQPLLAFGYEVATVHRSKPHYTRTPSPFTDIRTHRRTAVPHPLDGKLVAMAGERLHPAGWTEISAVCTDDAFRGQGPATRLVRAVGAGIWARGEIPFPHAVAANVTAIRLCEQFGFRHRRMSVFSAARVPLTALT